MIKLRSVREPNVFLRNKTPFADRPKIDFDNRLEFQLRIVRIKYAPKKRADQVIVDN